MYSGHFEGDCPRCGTHIPSERYATGYAICECGWTDTAPRSRAEKKVEKSVIITMSSAVILAALLYGHLMSWGSFAMKIPVTEIEKITGTLSADGYRELAQACVDLNKWECAEDAYRNVFAMTKDPAAVANLAYLQERINESDIAVSTFASYQSAGGHDPLMLLRYGKLLESKGREKEAMGIYEASIAADPQRLPVQATSAIVKIMMKQGQLAEAHQRILDFHKSSGNADGYLNTELAELEAVLHSSAAKKGKTQSGKHANSRSGQA